MYVAMKLLELQTYSTTELRSYSQQFIVRTVKQSNMFSVYGNVHLGCW